MIFAVLVCRIHVLIIQARDRSCVAFGDSAYGVNALLSVFRIGIVPCSNGWQKYMPSVNLISYEFNII